jgi:hypothetical protein
MVVWIVVVVCEESERSNIYLSILLSLVKCNKGASPGLICFNGGTCNNESEICHCRAGYQDQGSGCLLSLFRKIIELFICLIIFCRSLFEW